MSFVRHFLYAFTVGSRLTYLKKNDIIYTSETITKKEERRSMKQKPLYMQIMDELKQKIMNEEFDPDAIFTSEKKIMEEYKVSRITAARALNELKNENIIMRKDGSGSYLTKDAKKIIAENADFAYNKNGDTKIVAVIVPHVTFGGMTEYIKGMNEVLNHRGYSLSIYCSERSVVREAQILKELETQDPAGIICMPVNTRDNLEVFGYFKMIGKPLVFIDRYTEFLPISTVASDNRKGSKMLCDSFFDKGHTKIGYFAHGSISEISALKDRYFGYTDSLKAHGQTVNLNYIEINIKERVVYENAPRSRDVRYSKEDFGSHQEYEQEMYILYLKRKLQRLINHGVTALLCENDWIAMETASLYGSMGIQIPDRMELAGFDNVPELAASKYGKYISTAEQDFREIGRRAGRMFLDESMFGSVANVDLVPVKLILRNTKK